MTTTSATSTTPNYNDANCLSSNVKFKIISELFEKISQSTSIAKKSSILQGYIESFEKFRKQSIIDHPNKYTNQNASFFPILRMLLPQFDRDRSSYGIKTKSLGKLYVRILAINHDSEVAKKLTTEQKHSNKKYTDFGDVIYDVMKLRCSEESQITVFDVNRHLNVIADCYRTNNQKKFDDELIHLINGMTAIDQKWLTRILLRKMNFGLGPQKILQIYHPKASDLYDQYVHLSRVCECIESGNVDNVKTNMFSDTIELMQPFRPMLCQRLHISTFEQQCLNNDFYTETKMDGERFQMHMNDNGEFKYFSRNGFGKFTENFNETLTPFVRKLFRIPVTNIILDGEMMVWHKDKKMYCTKGENIDVKALKLHNPLVRPCFCVYDIVYLNGNCLTSKPYAERSRLLQTLFTEHIGFMTICKREKIRDASHFIECLNDAFDDKEEGLVVKNSDSLYAPGERNGGWWKIKADYIDGVISDLDLLVIGGYHKRGRMSRFLLGVHKKNAENDENGTLYAVAVVGSGLSRSQFSDLCEKLAPHWQRCQTIKIGRSTKVINPKGMEFGECTPDVWILPKNSIILEVKASELVQSKSHGTEFTLRFPRITAIRTDKPWNECCSFEEYEMLRGSNSKVEKLHKRHVNMSDINHLAPGKRQRTKISTINSSSNAVVPSDTENYRKIDNICENLSFCILSTNEKNTPPISEIEKMILAHGGRIVKTPSASTFMCIAGVRTLRVKSLVNANEILCNIATVDWLCRALGGNNERKKLLSFNPNDMICCKDELLQEFNVKYDEFGDSYTEKTTVDELRSLITKVPLPERKLSRNELYDFENELYHPEKSPNMFCLAYGLFYTNSSLDDGKLELTKIMFRAKGGQCIESIDENSDKEIYLIVNPDNGFDANILSKFSHLKLKCCLSYKWIYDCYMESKNIDHKSYIIADTK